MTRNPHGWRIEIDDVLDEGVQATDVSHLREALIRFKLASPRTPSSYFRAFLDGGDDISGILPEARNREAVRYNFGQLGAALAAVFEAHRDDPLFQSAAVATVQDFARLLVDHHCSPQWLYTNGQMLVSVVVRGEHAVDALSHRDVDMYLRFVSEYWRPADAVVGRSFASLGAAETWAGHLLSRVEVELLPLASGADGRTVLLQPAGTRRLISGERVRTVLVHHGRGVFRARIGPGEPYEFLNQFEVDGFRPRTCATCEQFRFSGMSRDMSGGSAGYCGNRYNQAQKSGKPMRGTDTVPPFKTVVNVFDACEEHAFIEDGHRAIPYLRRP